VSIDKFINDVNWLDIIGLHCLITLAGMLSNPEAFLYLFYLYFFQFYQLLYAGIQISKNFEKVFETQLSDFFDTIFNPFCVLSDVDMDARHVAQTSRRLACSPRQNLLYSISSDEPFKGF
jgi:hypothetical protein